MINANIPLLGHSPDMVEAVNNGFADGGNFAKLLIGSQVNRMRDIEDPAQRKAFADNNFFGRQLRGQLKQDQVAALQAQIDQQKAFADIDKTQSEAFKNNAQGQGYGLDNSGKKLGAIQGAFQQASLTGDKAQVLLGMNALVRTGMMTPEDYQAQAAIVNTMTPDELKQYAGGINFANAKDPAALLYTTADNRLDNDTSRENAQLSAETSRYGTDVSASVQREKIAQDQAQFDVNAYIQQNKPLDYFTAADGTRYAVYANGQGIPISNGQGAPIKAQQTTKPNTINKQLEQQDKVIAYQDAATTADEAAALARELSNDVNGLNKTTGGFGIMARIPGTDARDYAQRVETLKSQVFLTQVEKMKGMGALTDAEGARLEKSIASLDINLGEDQFKKNLLEIERVLSRAANSSRQRAQLYSGGQGQQQPQNTFNLFD